MTSREDNREKEIPGDSFTGIYNTANVIGFPKCDFSLTVVSREGATAGQVINTLAEELDVFNDDI